jgi:hypothetical protein
MAMTSCDTPVMLATQATKHRWNMVASSVAKMSASWSCDGVPSLNGRNRRRKLILPNQHDDSELLPRVTNFYARLPWAQRLALLRCWLSASIWVTGQNRKRHGAKRSQRSPCIGIISHLR